MAAALGVAGLASPAGATASARQLGVHAEVAPAITTAMPVLRLTFSAPVRAAHLPALRVTPHLATRWQQIGPRQVQAVVQGSLAPATNYVVAVPLGARCSARCSFTSTRATTAAAPVDVTLEDQMLAVLGYLPVTFTPVTPSADLTQPTPGTYDWAYPDLPSTLRTQWSVGADNVILRGALMAFQDVHHLPTSGVADAPTWRALSGAVAANEVDPRPYDYVDVSEASPETLTLYVRGKPAFHATVNTGISVSPTQLGTNPVYLRYQNQIMRGTNPDGTPYADPVSWVSYFYGGDALHQFYRSTYGWPQSLGCVEMTMSDAAHVWPYTPIGTLVTVRAA